MNQILLALLLLQQAPTGTSDTSEPVVLDASQIQAVVETTAGEFVIEFYVAEAPNHVAHFLQLVEEKYYDHTTFHSMFEHGIIQGGDPYSKEPERREEYGTGGFNMDLEPEFSDIDFTVGTVVATLLPGDSSSAGSEFFVCIGDQPQFTGQFTAFARVVEGIEVVDRISSTPIDENQIATERVEILTITVRPIPPPPVPPFTTESDEELGDYRVVMDTVFGEIVIEFLPGIAPNTVRHFLRLTALKVYDQTSFHRVAPGFVIQGGDLNTRTEPYPSAAAEFVVPIGAEPSDINHVRGIVSMARGEERDSALTSFFIVLADQPALDNFYTVFGHVVEGMDVVDEITSVETNGETPAERVDVYAMRVERIN